MCPCIASHFPPPEKAGGGALATASSTAWNSAATRGAMTPGTLRREQPVRNHPPHGAGRSGCAMAQGASTVQLALLVLPVFHYLVDSQAGDKGSNPLRLNASEIARQGEVSHDPGSKGKGVLDQFPWFWRAGSRGSGRGCTNPLPRLGSPGCLGLLRALRTRSLRLAGS